MVGLLLRLGGQLQASHRFIHAYDAAKETPRSFRVLPKKTYQKHSKSDPLNFLKRDVVRRSVIELRSPRRLVSSNVRGGFQCPAVLQVDRDPGRPEAVIADVPQ